MPPLPLSEFPPAMRAEIERLAALPTRPPQFVTLGDGLAQIRSRAYCEWNKRNRQARKVRRRVAIAERDNWICGICGLLIEQIKYLHIDHVIPFSLGGPTKPENLQASHSWCNLRKGARA